VVTSTDTLVGLRHRR